MPSKRTTNYNLSQWEADDKVLRTDFNDDNDKIDKALKALDTGKASTSALETLTATVNGKASQSELDELKTAVSKKAEQSVLEALQTVVSEKGNCRLQIGSYVGTGGQIGSLSTSFTPQVILIMGLPLGVAIRSCKTIFFVSSIARSATVTWKNNGISWQPSSTTTYPEDYCNLEGRTYYFAALG